jgi:hypothetical protein
MKNKRLLLMCLLVLSSNTYAEDQKPTTIEQRMQLLLPYIVDQTLESFSKTVHGGIQHVVVKSADNSVQIKVVQTHLRKMVERYRKGDFSFSEKLHGADMPGLAQLKAAKVDDIKYEYQQLTNGGQIHYSSEYPLLVAALHEWFDAQNKQHGNVEINGHKHHHADNNQ